MWLALRVADAAPGKRERAVLRVVRARFGRERPAKRQQRQAEHLAAAAR
jgi:hypothetical protein